MRNDIRLALPSKGLLGDGAVDFLAACGLKVYRPNPRQYEATIPNLPGLTVMFQRPGDIVVSVQEGSVDFGITGLDVLREKQGMNGRNQILTLHDALGFAPCRLVLAVPDQWADVVDMAGLAGRAAALATQEQRPLRVATKFPRLTGQFLDRHQVTPFKLVDVEGTLEIAPAIGYADLIADLVSTGTTLRDNHLRPLEDGAILESQACLIAHRPALRRRSEVLALAGELLEFIEAHLRAASCYLIFANIRGESPEAIATAMKDKATIGGLQGPTIAPVIPPRGQAPTTNWYAINIVVRKAQLSTAIRELRAVGGSGVIVAPVTYIFEEEPERYRAMLAAVGADDESETMGV